MKNEKRECRVMPVGRLVDVEVHDRSGKLGREAREKKKTNELLQTRRLHTKRGEKRRLVEYTIIMRLSLGSYNTRVASEWSF